MALQDLKDQAVAGLDAAFALGAAGGGVDPTPFSQADLDAAVKAAVDPISAALDAETVKDQGDAALAASLQSKLDQIKALIG